ncbi:MAG TPA: complex I subunit 1 family protein [Chthoniobacterales bacterium]|jgi:NADH-quinone oxidoreductase subunit H
MEDWTLTSFILISAIKTLAIIFGVVLPMVSYTVYAERKVSALIQDRVGPNRVGFPLTLFGGKKDFSFFGLIQPIADAVKLLIKEDFTPKHVNKFYYWLAPALGVAPALITLAVIPFGSFLNLDPILVPLGNALGVDLGFGAIQMVVANVDVGVLFIFAIASVGVYGIVLAGWSANSKYPFLGGIRSSSQMISYELSLGLSVIPIFLLIGNLNLSTIVQYQIDNGWLILPFTDGRLTLIEILLWIPIAISFLVFTVAMFAETNRLPFDLPEAEQELVGGYHTEYSSMKFALFFLGEYAAMIAGSAVIVTLFFGAWHLPFIPDGNGGGWAGLFWGLVNIATFFAKVAVLLIFFIWVRWTLPRFRYDQLMKLGWYFFFELALVNIFIAAIILAFVP